MSTHASLILLQFKESLLTIYTSDYDGDGPSDWADVDESEDSDDEMPHLEPAGTFDNPIALPPAQVSTSFHTTAAEESAEDAEKMPDFVAPGHEHMHERGYYVCIRGEQLAKYIPVFIKEYNVGPSLDDPMGMDMGMGPFAGPAGFNGIMNAMFGQPPPPGAMPLPMPTLNPHPGPAGGPGQAAPNGLFTVGAGPGYQMMMGTMPMPNFHTHANQAPTGGAAAAHGGAGVPQANLQAAPGAQADAADSEDDVEMAGGTTQFLAGADDTEEWSYAALEGHEEFLGEDDSFDADDGFDEDGGTTVADLD